MQKQRQPLPKRSRIPVRQVEKLVTDGRNFYLASDKNSEYPLTVVQRLTDDPSNWTFQDQDNRIYTPRRDTNTREIKQAPEKKYSGLAGLAAKAWDNASNWSNTVDVNNLFHPIAQTIRETNEGRNPVVSTAQFFDPTGISQVVPKVIYNIGTSNAGVGDAVDVGLLATGPVAGRANKLSVFKNKLASLFRKSKASQVITQEVERLTNVGPDVRSQLEVRRLASNKIPDNAIITGYRKGQDGKIIAEYKTERPIQDFQPKNQQDQVKEMKEEVMQGKKQNTSEVQQNPSVNPIEASDKPTIPTETPTETPTTSPKSTSIDNKKPELPKRQFGFKQVGKHIGKTYKVLGMAAAYAAGISPLVLGGYGIYQWSKPTPTAADSLVNQYKQQIPELKKLQQAVSLKQYTDSLKRSLANPSNQSIKSDTLITDGTEPEGYKESSQNNRSNDINAKATAADL